MFDLKQRFSRSIKAIIRDTGTFKKFHEFEAPNVEFSGGSRMSQGSPSTPWNERNWTQGRGRVLVPPLDLPWMRKKKKHCFCFWKKTQNKHKTKQQTKRKKIEEKRSKRPNMYRVQKKYESNMKEAGKGCVPLLISRDLFHWDVSSNQRLIKSPTLVGLYSIRLGLFSTRNAG